MTLRTHIEPYRIKAVEPIAITSPAERQQALLDAAWNLFRVPASRVTIDLLTDSGLTAMSARQWAALLDGDESYAGARSFERLEAVVQRLTGMPHFIPTHQGRAAEHLLFEQFLQPGDVVVDNTHFDTTRANIERVGGIAVDLPVPAAHDPALEAPFKGDLDVARLEAMLHEETGVPRLVIMTLTSNSCGGQPVSMANLERVRRLTEAHGIPLFLDVARFAENAWLVREREAGWREASPLRIAQAMFERADGCLMSAKKDALVHIGGFLALRSAALAERIRSAMVVTEGFPTYGGLAGRDMEAMAVGLEEVLEPSYLEDRIAQVRTLGDRLHAAGVPTVRPTGGHAVYLDSRAFAPHIDPLRLPGQSIACALFLHAGIRTCEIGQLMSGRVGPDGREAPVPLDLVRLAIPRRVYTASHLAYVAEAVIDVHRAAAALQPFEIVEQARALRHFTARLRPCPGSHTEERRPVRTKEPALA